MKRHNPNRRFYLAWLALTALLLLNFGSAYVPMGYFNPGVNVGISIAMTVIIMIVFMEVRHGSPILRIVAATGYFWLLLMFVLMLADILTRTGT